MKAMLLRCLAIGIAGFVGSITRYLVGLGVGKFNVRFPLGTLVINVTGSFFLGWFLTSAQCRGMSINTRLAIAVGFVGAYTTFSTYMYDTARLAEDGAEIQAIVNLIGSVALGLLAVRLGIMLARWT